MIATALAPNQPSPQALQNLGYLLDEFCQQQPGVNHALAVAGDGFPLSSSSNVGVDVRDQLCASVSGLTGMANGMAKLLRSGSPQDIVINFADGWLLVQRPSQRLILAVLAELQADMGAIHHQLLRLGQRAGQVLDPGARDTA